MSEAANNLLSEEVRHEIDHWLTKFPEDRRQSAVIPALTAAQEHNDGHLTEELMDAVAGYLNIPPVSVYEVATFYSMFNLKPVGKYVINVCTNISCMLMGSDTIVDHLERKLGIKMGGTTPDGKFTMKVEEECLAACAGGPMLAINGHYYEKLTPERLDEILANLD
ncbi:MAG: NAD(P)H-dependent oxidoreductase subunit E [Granulosicoccaceae bacterium]|jgi:NADH-quinone oxidoreductase subunit E